MLSSLHPPKLLVSSSTLHQTRWQETLLCPHCNQNNGDFGSSWPSAPELLHGSSHLPSPSSASLPPSAGLPQHQKSLHPPTLLPGAAGMLLTQPGQRQQHKQETPALQKSPHVRGLGAPGVLSTVHTGTGTHSHGSWERGHQ